MATKDISDVQVLIAIIKSRSEKPRNRWPYEILQEETGECFKVCWRALERVSKRDYVDYGVSLRTCWLTDKGKEFLKQELKKDL
jgi:hypothetical protein